MTATAPSQHTRSGHAASDPAPSDRAGGNPTKWVLIVAEALPPGLAANTAAVLALTLGRTAPHLFGPDVTDADGRAYPGLTTQPLPVLTADEQALTDLCTRATDQQILAAVVTDAAQQSKTYPDYTARLAATPTAQLAALGIAVHGPARAVNKITGHLRLLR